MNSHTKDLSPIVTTRPNKPELELKTTPESFQRTNSLISAFTIGLLRKQAQERFECEIRLQSTAIKNS